MYFYDENQPIAYNLEQLSLEPFRVTPSIQDQGRAPRCGRCASQGSTPRCGNCVGAGAITTCPVGPGIPTTAVGPGAITTCVPTNCVPTSCVPTSCVPATCVGPQGGCVNKWTTMRLRDGRTITMFVSHLDSKSVAGTLSTGQYLGLDLNEIMELTC